MAFASRVTTSSVADGSPPPGLASTPPLSSALVLAASKASRASVRSTIPLTQSYIAAAPVLTRANSSRGAASSSNACSFALSDNRCSFCCAMSARRSGKRISDSIRFACIHSSPLPMSSPRMPPTVDSTLTTGRGGLMKHFISVSDILLRPAVTASEARCEAATTASSGNSRAFAESSVDEVLSAGIPLVLSATLPSPPASVSTGALPSFGGSQVSYALIEAANCGGGAVHASYRLRSWGVLSVEYMCRRCATALGSPSADSVHGSYGDGPSATAAPRWGSYSFAPSARRTSGVGGATARPARGGAGMATAWPAPPPTGAAKACAPPPPRASAALAASAAASSPPVSSSSSTRHAAWRPARLRFTARSFRCIISWRRKPLRSSICTSSFPTTASHVSALLKNMLARSSGSAAPIALLSRGS